MKKLLFLLSFSFLFIGKVIGQTYTLTSGLPLAEISGPGTPVILTPTTPSAALPIGFSFQFYNNTYTDFYINPQGTISFGSSSTVVCKALVATPASHGNLLGASPEINNFIAFAWQAAGYDFSNAIVNYFTTGSAPNRILVVNYKGVLTSRLTYVISPTGNGGSKSPGNGQIDVQIQLYEGSQGKIEIHGTNNKTIPYPIFSPDADGPGQCGLEAGDGVTTIIASRYVDYVDNETYDFSNQAIRFTSSSLSTALTLTPSASPATISTTGSTTLSATVSGGTSPYSYTFTGPGTISQSGNTAGVSGLLAGVQTFTVVASDATTPTSQTVTGTVSVTVTEANTAPTVASPISPQSATMGQSFSYIIPANTFTDTETPNTLTLSVSGLPAGLNFIAPATINGTPTVSGETTVTVTATDPGGLSVNTSFTLTVNPAGVPQTITVSNTTPTQICGSKGTLVIINFTTTGTYSDPFYVTLVKTKKTSGYAPTTTSIKQVSTTTGSATMALPSYLASSYYTSNQEYLNYKIVVSNGSVTSADYAVTVVLPAVGSITVQSPGNVTSPGQTVHLSTPAAPGFSKTWYSHAETEYWQDGTLIAGQTADGVDVTPTTSTYYSVVYTDNSTGCSNRSNRVRVPFTITITGTSADGVYNEGRGVQLDGSGMVSGMGQPAPQYYVPSGADTDAQVYSTLFDLGFNASWSAYFIIRKSNIWEIYSGGHTIYAPVSYTRIYHTKNLFPTVSSGGRVAAPGGRQAATVRGIRPPENAVWIKDVDNSEQLLTLTGVSEENAAMPVALTYFEAKLTAQKQVALSWQTSFEHNADYFSVERSADLITFQPIGRVQANGTATLLKDYSLTDETPLRGLSYYRLNEVDLDGTSHVYPAVSIRTDGTDALYPNPSNGTFVNLDIAPTSTISLLTLQGESLPFDRKKVSESSVQLLPKTALTPGIYLITVNGTTRKWVVQ